MVMCRSERDQAEDGTHGGFGAGQDTEQAAGTRPGATLVTLLARG
jgi:hypothetical protein